MDKNLKSLYEVYASGNKLLLNQFCETKNYTDKDVREAVLEHGREVCRRLIAEGKVYSSDDIEEMIGDDGYDD